MAGHEGGRMTILEAAEEIDQHIKQVPTWNRRTILALTIASRVLKKLDKIEYIDEEEGDGTS